MTKYSDDEDEMIFRIDNVFSDEQREKMIEDIEPLLLSKEEEFTRQQTSPTLHLSPGFEFVREHILNLIEERFNLKLDLLFSWANLDYGEKKDMFWHTHPYDYACVYYIKTNTENGGTLFKDKSLNFVTAMQNSLILFNASLEHTAPPYDLHEKRYTLVMDLNRAERNGPRIDELLVPGDF